MINLKKQLEIVKGPQFYNGDNFLDYLYHSLYNECFKLTEVGNLYLHWSDVSIGIILLQEILKDKNIFERKKFNLLEVLVQSFKKSKRVIKDGTSVMTLSTYNLFNLYLENSQNNQSIFRPSMEIEELDNKCVPVLNYSWFDEKNYKLFIYNKILEGNIKLRKFRIRMNLPIHADFLDINNSKTSTILYLLQLTPYGLIFYYPSAKNLNGPIPKKITLKGDFTLFNKSKNVDNKTISKIFSAKENPLLSNTQEEYFTCDYDKIDKRNFGEKQILYFPYDHLKNDRKGLKDFMPEFVENVKVRMGI